MDCAHSHRCSVSLFNEPVQVIKARHVAELEKVKVHFTILENVKLVHIVRIFFDFLCNKTSDEIRSTNGDAKALKPRCTPVTVNTS